MDSPCKGPVMQSFGVFFAVNLNELVNMRWTFQRWHKLVWYQAIKVCLHRHPEQRSQQSDQFLSTGIHMDGNRGKCITDTEECHCKMDDFLTKVHIIDIQWMWCPTQVWSLTCSLLLRLHCYKQYPVIFVMMRLTWMSRNNFRCRQL